MVGQAPEDRHDTSGRGGAPNLDQCENPVYIGDA
jgi:hypothetical protein